MKDKTVQTITKIVIFWKKRHLTVPKWLFFPSLIALVLFSGCADLVKNVSNMDLMKNVTKIDRVKYQPVCIKAWKGKTIFIDFDTNGSWYYKYASNLSSIIKDQLIEDVVEDGCFHVQDRRTSRRYAYKIGVRIANPVIQGNNRTIKHISATFRIKVYNHRNDLITAKTRDVTYDAPLFVLNINNSQAELLKNYAYNVSVNIRKTLYESLK